MRTGEGSPATPPPSSTADPDDVAALLPIIRRVVGARVGSHPAADDLVQETMARVLAAVDRIEPGMLEPYAITTARNVVATMWRGDDRARRNQHRLLDVSEPAPVDDRVLAAEERDAVALALERLTVREREVLLAHEVAGVGTRDLADEVDSTPGAVAAQLKRTRAKLRVEYLIAVEQVEPPTDRCRPVLFAISGGDRRRQREVGAARHLLECDVCAGLSQPLLGRAEPADGEVRVTIAADPDIVVARQAARELAGRAGFVGVDPTLVATAVSEVARNIVRFAGSGEITVEVLEEPRRGIRVVARDAGPGIADVERAMSDGYSTYAGLGLGLPGARRLMDEFRIVSEPGRGTTVSMTKWLEKG